MKNDKYATLPLFKFSEYLAQDNSRQIKSALIFGNFGAKNFGDESILAGEIQELNKINNVNISVIARNPKEVTRLHKVNSVSLYSLPKVVGSIIKSDIVIVGGGGLICKADKGLWGILYQTYMLFLYFLLPLIFNKKIYALGMGVYKNTNPLVLELAISLLRRVSKVTVRDFHSYELLKRKNVKVEIYKDNSYLMDLESKSEISKDKILAKVQEKNRKNVGFALLKPKNQDNEKHLISEITKLILAHKSQVNFWFFPCDFQGRDNDLIFALQIKKSVLVLIKSEVNINIVPTTLSPQVFFSLFKLMDHMVTMRLHGAIFSYRNNIKITGITYDEKCTSFLESIGKNPISIQDFNAASIDL